MSRTSASRWVLAVAFVLSSAEAFAQTLSFVARRDFPVGALPRSGALGDFDGDGVLDVVVANSQTDSNTVSVMLGNGNGTFRPPRSFAADKTPWAVAVGDLNGDGMPDVAVSNRSSDNVSILLGNGDGTFQEPRNFPAGVVPLSIVVSDFNGDAQLDLAVANGGSRSCSSGGLCTYSGGVSALLGNGDGTFQAAQYFENLTPASFVALGDFDGDRVPDLIVTDGVGSVTVLVGNGDGTFRPAYNFDMASGATNTEFFAAVGDFNMDGSQDLAVTAPRAASVSVLLGNGDGTFQPAQNFATRGVSQFVAVGDFNSDRAPDLALVDALDVASVLLGNGDGTFQAASTFDVGHDPESIAVGDLNDDAVPDLAITSGSSVSVALGHGDGTFRTAPSFGVGDRPDSLAVGDFDGNGLTDVVVGNYNANGNYYDLQHAASVLLGKGDGTFQAASILDVAGTAFVAAGDFNGDRVLDLGVADRWKRAVTVRLGNGDGTFQTAQNVSVGVDRNDPMSLVVADLNLNGVPDLVIVHAYLPTFPYGHVSVMLGNGDGTFGEPRNPDAGYHPSAVAVSDLNGDGLPDLAIANGGYYDNGWHSGVSVLLGNGDGTFQANRFTEAGYLPGAIAAGDFNGDSVPDVAVTNNERDTISVLLGHGDGTFQAARTFNVGPFWEGPQGLAVGDFNADDFLDLAVGGFGNNVVVLLGNGDGTFRSGLFFGTGSGTQSIVVTDFNGDRKPDLAAVNTGANSVSVLMNDTLHVTYDLAAVKAGNGSGTVMSSSTPDAANQISCGTTCTATYSAGTQVILTAYADAGSTFGGWSGCDAVSETTCTVTMSEAKSVVATFVLQQFTLAVTKDGFRRGRVTSISEPASATQIDCGTTCSASYDWNTLVTLKAAPNRGRVFLGWSGCDSVSDSSCTVTMRADSAVTATFQGSSAFSRLPQ